MFLHTYAPWTVDHLNLDHPLSYQTWLYPHLRYPQEYYPLEATPHTTNRPRLVGGYVLAPVKQSRL